ncbi:hypothetical protein VCRA2116O29_400031 [Vibrio crassostreae]|nr:hypothetical protein VCRA2116O29_400031 [Vibrio crassostreae]CAK3797725.1 hypothetical protein VCRA2123O74_360031 [Vibrio crassostreae]
MDSLRIQRKIKILFLTTYNFAEVQPISLANLYLGASLYHDSLHHLIDYEFLGFDDTKSNFDSIAHSIFSKEPDILFVGCYVWNEKLIKNVTRIVREKAKQVTIIMGGLSVLYGCESFNKDYPEVDLFVRGEGEEVILDLVSNYISTDSKSAYLELAASLNGVSDHESFSSKHNERLAIDFDKVKSPFLIYNRKKSFFDYIEGDYKYLFMEFSRGCIYTCAFCSFDAQALGFRSAGKSRIKEELDVVRNKNVHQIFFVDAIWGGRKNDAKSALRYLAEEPLFYIEKGERKNTFLYGYFRPELIDEEFAYLLNKAEFSMVQLGIQTLNENVDRIMRRNNVPQILKNVPYLRKYGVPFQVDLIVGFPGDTFEGLVDSIVFVTEKCRPTNFRCYTLAVNPGTPLARLAEEKGKGWVNYDHDMKVLSSYSFNENEMERMVQFSNMAVALYDTYITNQDLDYAINKDFLLNFFNFCQNRECSESDNVLNGHQFEEKNVDIISLLSKFDSRELNASNPRRNIYGQLYTRGGDVAV